MSTLQADFSVPGTSVSRQRGATVVSGGVRMECGCWTKMTGTSFCAPSDMNYVYGVMCGSSSLTAVPEISSGYIVCAADTSFIVANYVAFGV